MLGQTNFKAKCRNEVTKLFQTEETCIRNSALRQTITKRLKVPSFKRQVHK